MHLLFGLQISTQFHENHLTESLCGLICPAASTAFNESTGAANERRCINALQIPGDTLVNHILFGPWSTPRCKVC